MVFNKYILPMLDLYFYQIKIFIFQEIVFINEDKGHKNGGLHKEIYLDHLKINLKNINF